MKSRGFSATESQEQAALFEWAALMTRKRPELDMLFHIPNGGKRDKVTAARLKAEGVKAGVPDICLPVARGGYHGLYIELKAGGGKPSETQRKWLEELKKQGYCALACCGWVEASGVIEGYLNRIN